MKGSFRLEIIFILQNSRSNSFKKTPTSLASPRRGAIRRVSICFSGSSQQRGAVLLTGVLPRDELTNCRPHMPLSGARRGAGTPLTPILTPWWGVRMTGVPSGDLHWEMHSTLNSSDDRNSWSSLNSASCSSKDVISHVKGLPCQRKGREIPNDSERSETQVYKLQEMTSPFGTTNPVRQSIHQLIIDFTDHLTIFVFLEKTSAILSRFSSRDYAK